VCVCVVSGSGGSVPLVRVSSKMGVVQSERDDVLRFLGHRDVTAERIPTGVFALRQERPAATP
jgi:hypothetical protein